ncbi:type II toxin-antitoxin system antitoxin SocA domain-containing protein [Novosphingobium sp.]|uniref:Panacea domain-containing protein n=1 Tax=Novosphingobium sp. TaxID=1874826 RepID=UPI00286DE196|nr:type II toxin-antitoxin system antitoxin SocA domain-containing protein [Novosphingobium sp.]
MPYSAAKIANQMLGLARDKGEEITPLKLLKLVYIAHGWSFPYLHEPLLAEPAQAWQYGPVVPSLYRAVSKFRAGPITEFVPDTDPQALSEPAIALIQSVYETYSGYSGTQLSNMTHMPNTPWSEAWNSHGKNAIIPNDRIAAHYQNLLETRGQPAA